MGVKGHGTVTDTHSRTRTSHAAWARGDDPGGRAKTAPGLLTAERLSTPGMGVRASLYGRKDERRSPCAAQEGTKVSRVKADASRAVLSSAAPPQRAT